MKTTLLITTALFASLSAKAQNPTPATPPPAKPDTGCVATPAPPQPPPIRFKLPPKIQAMLDKQRADFEKKTGIVLPPPSQMPPPPPKPKPCPPASPTPAAPENTKQ